MGDEKPYEQHRRDGTWPDWRSIEVVPAETGGRVDKLWESDGELMAGVTFPDGHVEVHRVDVGGEA